MAGFLSFKSKYSVANVIGGFGLFTTGGQSPEENTRHATVPVTLTVRTGSIVLDGSLGASKNMSSQVYEKSGLLINTFSGSAISVVDPATTTRGTMNGTMTGLANDLISHDSNAALGATSARETFTYICGGADKSICFHGGGTAVNTWAGSGLLSSDFYGLTNAGAITSGTESGTQVIWPYSGKFKYLLVKGFGRTVPSTIEVALRIDGVDTIFGSFDASAGQYFDSTSTAAVTSGQKVNIRVQRKTGDSTFVPEYWIGFSTLL